MSPAALPKPQPDAPPGGATARGERLATARRWALAGAVGVYLLVIFAWCVPGTSPGLARLRRFVEPALLYTGLWQGWDMFAPEPASLNARLEAEVTFADGSKTVWPFPHLARMGLWGKFTQERFRKWAIDRVRLDQYAASWPDTARWVARQLPRGASPPQQITLVRLWRTIPPPETHWVPLGHEDDAGPEQRYPFFQYRVVPADLAR